MFLLKLLAAVLLLAFAIAGVLAAFFIGFGIFVLAFACCIRLTVALQSRRAAR